MTAVLECPICMDDICSVTANCVTTECGHCFHTSCLMRNIAHNGFGCPYCRSLMAEYVEEEGDSSDDDSFIYEDDDTVNDMEEEENEDREIALQGMRLLFRRANRDIEDAAVEEEEEEEGPIFKRKVSEIKDTLLEAGYRMEDILKVFLITNGYEFDNENQTEEEEDELIEKVDHHMFKLIKGEIVPRTLQSTQTNENFMIINNSCNKSYLKDDEKVAVKRPYIEAECM